MDEKTIEKLEAQAAQLEALKGAVEKLNTVVERKSEFSAPNLNLKFGKAQLTQESADYLKWLYTGVKTATTTGSAAPLIPTELRAEVIRKLTEAAVIRPRARVVPMARETLELPVENDGVTATWMAENTLIPTSTDATFSKVTFTAKKLGTMVKLAKEVDESAVIDVAEYTTQLIAERFAKEEDAQFVNGANASTTTPEGIRNATGLGSIAQGGASLSYDDFVRLFFSLESPYRRDAVWLMADSVVEKAARLVDGQGRPLFLPDMRDGVPGTLMGRPIVVSNDMPATEILFGDLSRYVIADKRAFALDRTDIGGGAWENDLSIVKATERLDGKLTLASKSFKKLTGVA